MKRSRRPRKLSGTMSPDEQAIVEARMAAIRGDDGDGGVAARPYRDIRPRRLSSGPRDSLQSVDSPHNFYIGRRLAVEQFEGWGSFLRHIGDTVISTSLDARVRVAEKAEDLFIPLIHNDQLEAISSHRRGSVAMRGALQYLLDTTQAPTGPSDAVLQGINFIKSGGGSRLDVRLTSKNLDVDRKGLASAIDRASGMPVVPQSYNNSGMITLARFSVKEVPTEIQHLITDAAPGRIPARGDPVGTHRLQLIDLTNMNYRVVGMR